MAMGGAGGLYNILLHEMLWFSHNCHYQYHNITDGSIAFL